MTSKLSSIFVVSLIFVSATVKAQFKGEKQLDPETQFYQELAKEVTEEGVTAMVEPNEVPNGLSTKDMSPQCDPRRLEDSALKKNLSTFQYHQTVKKYFEKCSSELTQNSTLGILGLLKFAQYQYPFFSHPQVKKFMVKLPSGIKIPGILALKQDPRPRPLVIVKCGVFCSADESASTKSYLMHLFDQSPFNVLLLANQTGMDYIYQNKKISLGGWDEGYEVIEVGKWMQDQWEYKDRISSVHFMGISLGGNAAVMGAAFNDKFLMNNGKRVFNSVTAICPVVSLKPTLDHLYARPMVGRIFSKLTKNHFQEARQYVLDVPDLISDDKIPDREGLADFIGSIASASLRRRGFDSSMKSFFKSNNFWNWKEEVKTPLMVWASRDDIVVNNRLNADVVANNDNYEKSKFVSAINLDYGNHCGFSSAYGAQVSATVLRTFVLNHSPEFIDEYNIKQKMPWTFGFEKLSSQYEHVNQYWNFYSQSDKVKVSFKIYNWNGSYSCGKKGPWQSKPSSCTTTKEYWIPIANLETLGARIPRNSVEAQSLTREFNTKVEFRIQGHPLNGTNSSEFFMTWRNRFE